MHSKNWMDQIIFNQIIRIKITHHYNPDKIPVNVQSWKSDVHVYDRHTADKTEDIWDI